MAPKTVKLTKSISVLSCKRAGSTSAHFQATDKDAKTEADVHVGVVKDLYMPIAHYLDLGEPEVITVTVEPGDKLNA